jgi:hypothetical protein
LIETYIAIRYGAPQIAAKKPDVETIHECSHMNFREFLAGIRRLRVHGR